MLEQIMQKRTRRKPTYWIKEKNKEDQTSILNLFIVTLLINTLIGKIIYNYIKKIIVYKSSISKWTSNNTKIANIYSVCMFTNFINQTFTTTIKRNNRTK
jgi:hypothetical protein